MTNPYPGHSKYYLPPKREIIMAWKKGPLPLGTFGYGAIVTQDLQGCGFYFADFCGDHVKVMGTGPHKTDGTAWSYILKAEDVIMYDNSLELPPKEIP